MQNESCQRFFFLAKSQGDTTASQPVLHGVALTGGGGASLKSAIHLCGRSGRGHCRKMSRKFPQSFRALSSHNKP